MSRWYGKIGFNTVLEENGNGIYSATITEMRYFGDMSYKKVAVQNGLGINGTLQMNSVISIICDPFAHKNHERIVYATVHDTKWSVTAIEFEDRRLKLTLGGVYNEQRAVPSETQSPDGSTGSDNGNWWEG